MKKKFLIDTILYAAAPKLPSIVSFLLLPIITPYLSLNDYGKYGMVIACYSLFQLTVTLGQKVILQNSFFEYKNKYNLVWSRSYGIMIMGSILGSLCMAIAFFFLVHRTIDAEYLVVTGICIFALICSPIESLAQVYYIMRERPYAIILRSLIMSFINIIILLLAIKYFKLGYIGLVMGFASSSVFSLLFYLYPICIKQNIYPLFFFKKKHLYEYLKIGLPLLPHYLSLSIFNTSDRILLGFFKVNVSAIGLYSQGYGIGSNAMVFNNGVFSAIGKTLQVSFRNKTKEDKKKLQTLFVFLIAGIGILFFNGGLWMKEIYTFLFRRPELQTGYPVAILVLMANIFFPLYSFGVYSLFIASKTKVVAKITMIAAGVNVVLNMLLIPFFSIWATLVSTFISFIFLSVVVLCIKEVQNQLSWLFGRLNQAYIFSILYGIAMTILVWFFKDMDWSVKLIVSGTTILFAGFGYYYRRKIFSARYSVINLVNDKFKNIQ
ncbi:MAG TPA: oligosaccharide flippase family protein [Chitinophagaceae bacterium]|jgi:O-antigen/teichoic acid export membrane protein